MLQGLPSYQTEDMPICKCEASFSLLKLSYALCFASEKTVMAVTVLCCSAGDLLEGCSQHLL